jgi:thioredoxin 1
MTGSISDGRCMRPVVSFGGMPTVALTKDTFKDAVEKGGIVLVDWWAEWCGPCRAFAPAYERASEKHPEAVFAKIDTDAERELAAAFQIQSIPTLMIFRDKILLFAQAGALPERVLEELIGKVAALDMDEVRRQIAEQQAAEAPPS